jgi:hypothetical protein
MLAKHALSQLSYGPILVEKKTLASARRRFAPSKSCALANKTLDRTRPSPKPCTLAQALPDRLRREAPQARTRAAPDGAKAKRTDVRAGD